jgi:hypothetical protein
MSESKQNMNGVSGKNVSQRSDAKTTNQSMEGVKGRETVQQEISSQPEKNSLRLAGFGKANGRWAVIVIGLLFALFLAWKYLSAR